MRPVRYFTPLIVAVPGDSSTQLSCTDTGGSTTECTTPGDVQIDATPSEPTYLYPWDDESYGPALIIGGGGGHGGR
jgi:hypothetical protein